MDCNHQVRIDFFFWVSGLLELSEAIRDYHDSTMFSHMFQQQQELTVDDIEDFDDDDDLDEVDSRRYSRRVLDDAVDLVLGLSSFATGCNLFAF
ncbi:hypothetical protein KY284_026834 [Solanum tuberosum]|nr:hypothetical protein KY284_026834 [Solanum tuberosum]